MDTADRHYSSAVVTSHEQPSINSALSCGKWCLDSIDTEIDHFIGFTFAHVLDTFYCFCHDDKKSVVPSGAFASSGSGEGVVGGTDGRSSVFCYKFDPPTVRICLYAVYCMSTN